METSTYLTDIRKKRIQEAVEFRFNNEISPLEVVSWLYNFQENDWDLALTVLEGIDYYSFNRIVETFYFHIKNIIIDHKLVKSNMIFHILPVGNAAKSGDSMNYILRKVFDSSFKQYTYHHYKLPTELEKIEFKENDILILVDDYIGSGDTFEDFVNDYPIISRLISSNMQIFLLSIIIQIAGKLRIERKYANLLCIAEVIYPIFTKNRSIFGYYPKMCVIREFCHRYGKELVKKENILGYRNSQSLIVFNHSTPNNTLPIIWSSNFVKKRNKKWYPLFPRFVKDRIAQMDISNQDTYKWLPVFNKLYTTRELPFPESINRSLFSKENYLLISILRLLSKKISVPVICNYLSINYSKYVTIIEHGITLGLFLNEKEITEYGQNLYQEILKELRINNKKVNEILFSEELTIFVPETFQGLT